MDIRVDDLTGTLRIIDENGEVHEYNMQNELKVNEVTLGQELLQQPVKYLYWGSVLEKVNAYLDTAKWQMDILEANLRDEARLFFAKQGARTNAQMIDDYAKQKDSWKIKRTEISNLEYIVKQTKLIVKAFEQRKDMLQSYGAQIRNDINYGNKAGDVSTYR